MPPTEAKSIDDFRELPRVGGDTKRTFFIQTTGGASGIVPDVKLLVELCKEFPNFGYIKEEYKPVIERMTSLLRTVLRQGSFQRQRQRGHVIRDALGL